MKIPKIKKIILSGGGIKGIAIASALETLDDKIQLFSTVREIIGSSIRGLYRIFHLYRRQFKKDSRHLRKYPFRPVSRVGHENVHL